LQSSGPGLIAGLSATGVSLVSALPGRSRCRRDGEGL